MGLTALKRYQSDEKTFAEDVTVNAEGNAYVTDVKGSKIWKIGVNGELLSTIKSPLFASKECYKNLFTLMARGPLSLGDGIELLSPTKLVVAGTPLTRLVERNDNWESARVIGKYSALRHRLPTATTVKDRKVYIRHLFGMGYPGNKHALVEALFTS
ncbi:hypothetical protein LguiB_030398 [Lonicera macranthoides]